MDIQKIKNKGLYKDRERIKIGVSIRVKIKIGVCQKYIERNLIARKYNYLERR